VSQILTNSEIKNRDVSRVSIVSLNDIKQGTIITEEMVDIRRPGTGLPPEDFENIIGKRAAKDIEKDSPLKADDIE